MMDKKYLASYAIISLILAAGAIFYFEQKKEEPGPNGFSPSVSFSLNPTTSGISRPDFSPSPTPTPRPQKTPRPSVTPYPWEQFTGEASCELKGEIKFLNSNTFDNQDALFSYKGVDHMGRVIFWNISPGDDLSVGPNLFARMVIPDGESLITVSLPEKPKSSRYELTASINYGRLVDGNLKIFTKACTGKTVVVLP